MNNRTAAVIITILVVFLCGCPGLAFLCFGLSGFLFINNYDFQSYVFGTVNNAIPITWGLTGICIGLIFILFTVIVSFFVLRKKKETTPASMDEPLPPVSMDEPLPPAI
jgi:hypothetical protein